MMGGYTRFLPDEDRRLWTRSQFLDNLAAMLGGRAAEEVVLGEITTGAEDDIQKATQLARRMVTEYGMSDRLGPRTYGKRETLIFLGRDLNEIRNYSEKIAQEIDAEVNRLILEAYQRAREVLLANRPKLDRLAAYLLAHESVEGEELKRLLGDEPAGPEGTRAAAD
jgi:cell division protease FtsH